MSSRLSLRKIAQYLRVESDGSPQSDVINSSETGRLTMCDSFSQLMMLLPRPFFSARRARPSASSQSSRSPQSFLAFFFVIKTSNRRPRHSEAEVQSHGHEKKDEREREKVISV
jgi:hypothetical protein